MKRRIRLEYQADRIEATLANHKVRSRVSGGTVTPRFVRFDLLPAPGTRIQKISALAEELALTLDAPSCRVQRRGGRVQIEVPRPDPAKVRFEKVCTRLNDVPACRLLWFSHSVGIVGASKKYVGSERSNAPVAKRMATVAGPSRRKATANTTIARPAQTMRTTSHRRRKAFSTRCLVIA